MIFILLPILLCVLLIYIGIMLMLMLMMPKDAKEGFLIREHRLKKMQDKLERDDAVF